MRIPATKLPPLTSAWSIKDKLVVKLSNREGLFDCFSPIVTAPRNIESPLSDTILAEAEPSKFDAQQCYSGHGLGRRGGLGALRAWLLHRPNKEVSVLCGSRW